MEPLLPSVSTTANARPLRIGIDVRMFDASQGVKNITHSLIDALWRLSDGEGEQYVLIGCDDGIEHFSRYRDDRFTFWSVGESVKAGHWKVRLKNRLLSSPLIDGLSKNINSLSTPNSFKQPAPPPGFASLGLDVVHFISPRAFTTRVPSIYHQYDLQHLHLPQFFTTQEIAFREARYRTFCQQASLVVVMTSWGERDLMERYAVERDRIAVVPCAPVRHRLGPPSLREMDEVRTKFRLPAEFILYPAQTFPHKNHLTLLEALAVLRDRDKTKVPLVCCGQRDRFFQQLQNRVHELQLDEQVRFVGLIEDRELATLYLTARFLVFPSLFEGWGLPVTEALASGLPVCCTDIEPLRLQAGDAARYFDATDATAMARAILDLWQAHELREDLAEKGKQRAALFSWERAARIFRAHYRRIAGRRLTGQDECLLCALPLV